jgi:hypothetical protein
VLHAYDANNLASELYNTSQNAARDLIQTPVKFAVPTVANGKVYLGAASTVGVYGLLASMTPTPDVIPWGGTYDTTQTIVIKDDRADAIIYYTTDGSTPTQQSPIYDGPFQISASTIIKAVAAAPGASLSNVRVASFTIVHSEGGGGSVNYGSGFQDNGLVLRGAAKLAGSRLRLTDGGPLEAADAWFKDRVNVQSFTQDFLIQITDPLADGMSFVIQNVGNTALAFGGANLGYSPLSPSVGVKFDLYDNAGEGPNSTGLYTGGAFPSVPAVDLRGTPINLHSQHVFAVHMTYDGTILDMQITDTDNNQSFSKQWAIDIPATLGGPTAYIGFGGGTGGLSATQEVLAWTYVSQGGTTPTPDISPWGGTYDSPQTVTLQDQRQDAVIHYTTDGSTPTLGSPVYSSPLLISSSTVVKAIAVAPPLDPSNVRVASFTITQGGGGTINYGYGFQANGLKLVGKSQLIGSTLRLTDGGSLEAANAWFSNSVNVQSFTQDFLIQLTDPSADGMSFVIQNVGNTALALAAGNLGYTPLSPSVGVKFDLYNNIGEGPNSTGLYTGGAVPMLPAIDLTGTGIDLHSQHVLQVHMTYDGATLAMQITDTETNQNFSTHWSVDIPAAVGGSTAYVGFGAGTGGLSATQDVLAWTFVSQSQGRARPAPRTAGRR